jgi:hypothetical protein
MPTHTSKGTISPGTKVEVRTVFDRSWTKGFTVEERTSTGYRLRRRSDGHVLPRVFPFDEVRHERHDLWWV